MPAKILICDDDEGIVDLISLILNDEGFTTIPEMNSLNVATTVNQQRPDLLILDLWMPVLSGDQVLRNLRMDPASEQLPVIVISASRDGEAIARQAGASEFVAKPFDLELLIEKIKMLLGSRNQLN